MQNLPSTALQSFYKLNPDFDSTRTVFIRYPILDPTVEDDYGEEHERYTKISEIGVFDEFVLTLRIANMGLCPKVLAAFPMIFDGQSEEHPRFKRRRLFVYIYESGYIDFNSFFTSDDARNVAAPVVRKLIEAAEKGVLLADCKPENLVIKKVHEEYDVRFIDFDSKFTFINTLTYKVSTDCIVFVNTLIFVVQAMYQVSFPRQRGCFLHFLTENAVCEHAVDHGKENDGFTANNVSRVHC